LVIVQKILKNLKKPLLSRKGAVLSHQQGDAKAKGGEETEKEKTEVEKLVSRKK
jgi:hypothetical protein